MLSLGGRGWTILIFAAFDDSRAKRRHLAMSTGFIVVEGEQRWESTNGFIKAHALYYCQGDHNRRAALAYQLLHIVGVVEHAAMMLCHVEHWRTVLKGIPTLGWTVGGHVGSVYEDMTIAMFGIAAVGPMQDIAD